MENNLLEGIGNMSGNIDLAQVATIILVTLVGAVIMILICGAVCGSIAAIYKRSKKRFSTKADNDLK